MKSSVDVVIVNWNTGEALGTCLGALAGSCCARERLASVTVVDNASSDGSDLVTGLPLPLRTIRNAENRGFAAACNQGARTGTAPFVLFLNPDVVVTPTALVETLDYLEAPANRHVGVCGVSMIDDAGQPALSCSRFPTAWTFLLEMIGAGGWGARRWKGRFMRGLDVPADGLVDQVIGAYFLVRRQLFEELGGFDERFFVYYEELDFSLRASKSGWRSACLASVTARHTGGVSTARAGHNRLFYSLRSRHLYTRKHFAPSHHALVALATVLVEVPARLGRAVCRRSMVEVGDTAKAVGLFLRYLQRPSTSPAGDH